MATDITESRQESAEEFAARFAGLAATWENDTRHESRMGKTALHPAFREIVSMGEKAIPMILAQIEENGSFLFLALREITGDNPPIPEGYRGNKKICAGWVGYDIEGTQAAWLAWGREKGYWWKNAV